MIKNIKRNIMAVIFVITIVVPQVVSAEGFGDVGQDKWYYQDIKQVEEKGIIKGYEDNTYRPENTITRVEALKVVIESHTELGIPEEQGQNKWYTKYINYGTQVNIEIEEKDKPATRAEIAEYIVKVYDKETSESEGFLADTKDKNIERLHKDKIMLGVGEEEGKAVINPDSNITRAEMAALINRVINESKEETSNPERAFQGGNKTKGVGESNDIIKEDSTQIDREEEQEEVQIMTPKQLYRDIRADKVETPTTENNYIAEFFDMIEKNELERQIFNANVTRGNGIEGTKITEAYTKAYDLYPEIFSYTNRITITRAYTDEGEHITVVLGLQGEERDTKSARQKLDLFEEKAYEVVKKLIEEGKITNEQTQLEKAKVLYRWVIQNTDYKNKNINDVHTGYEQLKSGEVVCQGYVSTYNYLLRLVGIEDVKGISGTVDGINHIWTEAVLDGRTVLIDPTFGDPLGNEHSRYYVDYYYFDISRRELRETHIWN